MKSGWPWQWTKIIACLSVQGLLATAAAAQREPTEAELEYSRAWIAGVSASSPSTDILLATMMSQQLQPSSMPELLGIEFASPEHHKLRLSIAFYYCLNNGNAGICQDNSFASDLIRLDPDNLEPYLYAMVGLLDAGRDEEALAVLAEGNQATQANSWYLAKMNLVREALRNSAYPQDRINWASESLAGALDTYRLYVRLLAICTEKSAGSPEWKAQCSALGSHLVSNGKTVVQNVHGFAIQRDALGGSDPESAIKAGIIEKMAAYNQIRDLVREKLDWWDNPSLKPDLVYEEEIRFGEIQAIERALQRLE